MMNLKNETNIMKIFENNCTKYFPCLYDVLIDNKYSYIIMEYLDGYVDLFDAVTNEKYDRYFSAPNFIKNIINNLCNGMNELHKLNITHNDIKLENIMINMDTGDVKYIDYGGSCVKNTCDSFIYTTDYADPLIIKFNYENKDINPNFYSRSKGDIWSLGCVFYVMFLQKYIQDSYKLKYFKKNRGVKDFNDFFDDQKNQKKFNEYFIAVYEYIKDPNKEEINRFLNTINCNLQLQNFLTLDLNKRTGNCNC